MDDRHSPITPDQQSCEASAEAVRSSLARMTVGEVGLTLRSRQRAVGTRHFRKTVKGKKLFEKVQEPPTTHQMPSWSADEEGSQVSFLMLYTAGNFWAAHKHMQFWNSAGKFIQQETKTSHCRSGEYLIDSTSKGASLSAFIYLGKACKLRATTALCKRFKSPLEANAHFSQQLSSPSSDSVMNTGVVDQLLVVSKQQQTDECLKFFCFT